MVDVAHYLSRGTTQDALLAATVDLLSMLKADLPATDFTPAQAAVARLPLPFRNLMRDPFRPDIASTPKTTAYPQAFLDGMAAKGCSSFRIINPNSCPIRFRGATGMGDLIQDGEGRILGPWQTEVFSTQNPTHLSVMLVVDAEFTMPTVLRRPELNYGIGS